MIIYNLALIWTTVTLYPFYRGPLLQFLVVPYMINILKFVACFWGILRIRKEIISSIVQQVNNYAYNSKGILNTITAIRLYSPNIIWKISLKVVFIKCCSKGSFTDDIKVNIYSPIEFPFEICTKTINCNILSTIHHRKLFCTTVYFYSYILIESFVTLGSVDTVVWFDIEDPHKPLERMDRNFQKVTCLLFTYCTWSFTVLFWFAFWQWFSKRHISRRYDIFCLHNCTIHWCVQQFYIYV